MLLGSGATVDPSGHRVPQRRVQAQLPLQTPLWHIDTGARNQEGLKLISEANLKHGRQTKDSWQPSATQLRSGVGFGVS